MIELVFSTSAGGSLKVAQGYGRGRPQIGQVGAALALREGVEPAAGTLAALQKREEKRARLAWERATPVGGSSEDVYALDLALSLGDISEAEPGLERLRVLERLCVWPGEEALRTVRELFDSAKQSFSALRRRVKAGEKLRVWYGTQPDELCGFYWLMDQLDRWQVSAQRVSLVKLPEWEEGSGETVVRHTAWGAVHPGYWGGLLAQQRPLPSALLRGCAHDWQVLQQENAPLRAVLNGRLVSAPETLYDSFILREIARADESFQEAEIIGQVLSRYQLGVGDAWVALRIEEQIQAGRLEIVTQAAGEAPFYRRTLRKRG